MDLLTLMILVLYCQAKKQSVKSEGQGDSYFFLFYITNNKYEFGLRQSKVIEETRFFQEQ